jgi:hypothetical protein
MKATSCSLVAQARMRSSFGGVEEIESFPAKRTQTLTWKPGELVWDEIIGQNVLRKIVWGSCFANKNVISLQILVSSPTPGSAADNKFLPR